MKSTLAQLNQWIDNSQLKGDCSFNAITTDSRVAKPGTLFVALKGERFDGHSFLMDLINRGVAGVVVEKCPENYPLPSLIVKDTKKALGQIAKCYREKFQIPVIGVAGSNGKTTVKEMIASILKEAYGEEGYLATTGNLNNDIGVPLTLFNLKEKHRAAVVELGMNHVGEMKYLVDISRPTVGLVNNAQREHQEFMRSISAVAEENGTVILGLPDDGVAVFPNDELYSDLWKNYAGDKRCMTFGFNPNASVTAHYVNSLGKTDIEFLLGEKSFGVTTRLSGQHNVRNAMAAVAATSAIGIDINVIKKGLASFSAVKGRLEYKQAQNGAQVIDDTYNANPDSVRAAIDVLASLNQPCGLVLGDMGEVGEQSKAFHEEVGLYAKEKKIDWLMTFGTETKASAKAFGENAKHVNTIDELNLLVAEKLTPESVVLVKGSRFMKMERVVQYLTTKKEGFLRC